MKKNIPTILLTILVLVQPLLDLYCVYENPTLELFGFKYTTIVRYGILFLMGLIIIWQTKIKKYRKPLVIYSIFLIVYIIAHCIHNNSFNSLYPEGIGYSVLEELLYILRYMMPITIIYYMNSLEIKENWLKKTLLAYCLAVSSSVIITNIFYIARASYTNLPIQYNIIDWFIKDINYLFAASKGLFYSTSVITSLLIITPYMYSEYYKKGKLIYLTTIVFNMLALFIVGTRACSYGFIIIAVLMLSMYLFFSIIVKKLKFQLKHIITSTFIIILSIILLQYSPTSQRVATIKTENDNNNSNINEPVQTPSEDSETNNTDENLKEPVIDIIIPEEPIDKEPIEQVEKTSINSIEELREVFEQDFENKKELAIDYIARNKSYLGIYAPFLDRYYYEYDYEFWVNILLNEPTYNKENSRYIEEQMLKRVKEINNDKIDDYLGISYSRTSKIFNLERDFLYQYYSMGILGVIVLLLPLVIMLLIAMFKIITNKEKFNLENCSLCLGIGLILAISVYSGDVVDNIVTNSMIGIILGLLLNKTLTKKDNSNCGGNDAN